MRLRSAGRIVLAWTIIGVLVSLSLYLWSPWHQHPVQGRKACAFLQVEQGNALEAGAIILPAPPSAVLACPAAENVLVRAFGPWPQHGWRAPPAI